MTKTRLEAFSDGVFSIAITLLALNIRLPDDNINDNARLIVQLKTMLPNILTFIFSFLAVGIFWVAHNRIFYFIKQVDHYIMWLNIFYLMGIAIMPFPAYLLARHPFLPAAVLIYASLLFIRAMLHMLFLNHLQKNTALQHEHISTATYARARNVGLVGPVCYALAAISTLAHPFLSFGFIAAAIIFYIFIVHRVFTLKDAE